MVWKKLRTALALTCAMVITVMLVTPAAASTSTKDATQTTAVFDKKIDKVGFEVLAMAPGGAAGSIVPDATFAQIIKDGGAIMVEKKMSLQLYVAATQPTTGIEVTTAVFVTKAPIAIASFYQIPGAKVEPAAVLLC